MHGTEEKMKNFNMMKKLLALTLGAAMLLAVMTGCGKKWGLPCRNPEFRPNRYVCKMHILYPRRYYRIYPFRQKVQ